LTGCLSRLPCHKFGEIFGQNFTASQTFFFLKKIKKYLNTTLIQLPMADLKNTFFSTGWLSYLPQKGKKSTFWAISPVSSVAISLKKNLVPPWVISNFCYYWCTVVRWREIYLFFENDLFDPGIGYYTPKISLEKCFSRLSSTQWSIFTIHSGPLGGNSQNWVSTVVR
jgi:hypothetical protein